MKLEDIANVIWRVVGILSILQGLAAFIIQVSAIESSFGRIMDSESMYSAAVVYSVLIWPILSFIFGWFAIAKSRYLAELVTRGLGD